MKDRALAAAISSKIYVVRGHKVMLDKDLAQLYGVPTRQLNQQVKRNLKRFPPDFMFRLTSAEMRKWKSQIVTSNWTGKMGFRKRPLAFTEQGVAMLSTVLHSERAIIVNIAIMRTFVRMRKFFANHEDLRKIVKQLEFRMNRKDAEVQIIFETIRRLIGGEDPDRARRIGFNARN